VFDDHEDLAYSDEEQMETGVGNDDDNNSFIVDDDVEQEELGLDDDELDQQDNNSNAECDEEEAETFQDTQQLFEMESGVASEPIVAVGLPHCIEKGKITVMKILPLNLLATTDYMELGKKAVLESKLVETRELEKKRYKREDYFLRDKLFNRLKEMECDTMVSDRLADGVEAASPCQVSFLEYQRQLETDN
jgi:hypothetical protein